jgi:hypothetical protein
MSSMVAWERGTRAEDPLEQTEENHLGKALGDAAQHRGGGEPRHTEEKEIFAAEAGGKPAHGGRHDRRRSDVAGEHPGDLIRRRREASLHIGQGDIGDGRIERLHQRRDHHAYGDDAAVGNRRAHEIA